MKECVSPYPSQLLLSLVGTELLVAMEMASAHSLCLKNKSLRSWALSPAGADSRDEQPTSSPRPGPLFSRRWKSLGEKQPLVACSVYQSDQSAPPKSQLDPKHLWFGNVPSALILTFIASGFFFFLNQFLPPAEVLFDKGKSPPATLYVQGAVIHCPLGAFPGS